MSRVLLASFVFVSCSQSLVAFAAGAADVDRRILPIRSAPFAGVIGDTVDKSKSSWPTIAAAPKDAPNVLLVMTDDVAFGAASTFGGPIPTPHLDRLVANGLRYTRFHTTALCSPSRASLLTGRNHHAVGSGEFSGLPSGYPGYVSVIPKTAATLGRILQANGYSTAFFGKHNNVPPWEAGTAGPFDQWPTNLGFDYFFGYVGGSVDQWYPRLFRGTTLVEETTGRKLELLDKRLTDDALDWIHRQQANAAGRPFFVYYASGSGHAPHQAPRDWIAKFRGKFDKGWDAVREETYQRQLAGGTIPKGTELTPRPSTIPAWESLSPAMKRVNARSMEVYAAQIAYQDEQFGRLVDELKRMGKLDNTFVIFIEGDNGASGETSRFTENQIGHLKNGIEETDRQLVARIDLQGGPETQQMFASGWSHALSAPFPRLKYFASHLGGTRNGAAMLWPKKITDVGQTRTAFAHLNDILPTVLDAAGIPAPTKVDGFDQQRIDGVSLVPTFTDAGAEPHRIQYFEIGGNRAIYRDGWMASTTPLRESTSIPEWKELYDLENDFSQARNLASKFPEKLKELVALWETEGRRNNVYPLWRRSSGQQEPMPPSLMPTLTRNDFDYWGKGVSVTQAVAPAIAGRSFVVTASIEIDSPKATGVIVANGSKFGGWAFYLKDGKPIAVEAFSQMPGEQFRVAATKRVPPGKSIVRFEFKLDGPAAAIGRGEMAIFIDDSLVGKGTIPRTLSAVAGLGETFDIGRDTGVAVTKDYDSGEFPGEIHLVKVSLQPTPTTTTAGGY